MKKQKNKTKTMRLFLFEKKLFYVAAFLVVTTISCSVKKIKEAEKTIHRFYSNYKPGDYRVADKTLLSKDLNEKIIAATLKQSEDAARLKSIGSTDKPLMIEGDIYTSLAEGATGYEILQSFAIDELVKSEVRFNNMNYNLTWTDTIILKKEEGAWKIADILYTSKQGGAKGTNDVLSVFLQLPNQ